MTDEMSDSHKKQKVLQPEFDPNEFLDDTFQPMLEENEYEILIAKTRFQYFVDNIQAIQNFFNKYKLIFTINEQKSTCSIKNTSKTSDPTSVLIARQMVKLLARYVDIDVAQKVFNAGVESEIIQINMCNKQETFLKRRERFIGRDRQTLTALELLTNTNLQVYGNTLAIVGTARGIQLITKIAKDSFGKNILPSYWIKVLMIRRELEKIPELQDKDWSNFMPKLKKSQSHKKGGKIQIKQKLPAEERGIVDVGKYTERKIDQQMEKGEGGFGVRRFIKKNEKSE